MRKNNRSSNDATRNGAEIVRLDEVEPKSVDWLWPGHIPTGMLTIISGDPGVGKSYLTNAIDAMVSTGRSWPGTNESLSSGPGSVVMLNAEDSLEHTVVPRLIASGADLSRIRAVSGVRTRESHTTHFCLGRDIDVLRGAITEIEECRLVVIDPVSAYLGNLDANRNEEVRGVLAPLARLAEENGVAIVLVSHLTKSAQGVPAIYRTLGSIAFLATARAAFQVDRDPNDDEWRILFPAKCNIGPELDGIRFRIVDGIDGPTVAFDSKPYRVSPDYLRGTIPHKKPGPKPEVREEAVEWLRRLLAEGPVDAKDVFERGEAEAFGAKMLRSAKNELPVSVEKVGVRWVWRLEAPPPEKPFAEDD